MPFILKNFTPSELSLAGFFPSFFRAVENFSVEWWREILSQDLIFSRELFSEVRKDGRNIFFYAIENDSPEVFDMFVDKAKTAISASELSNLLTSSDNYGKNLVAHLLTSLIYRIEPPDLKTVLDKLEKATLTDDLRKMLMKSDNSNCNALHCALENCDSSQLQIICEFLAKVLSAEDWKQMLRQRFGLKKRVAEFRPNLRNATKIDAFPYVCSVSVVF